MHELRQGAISLAAVASHGGEIAPLLARTVAGGDWGPEPAERRTIRVGGKRREVFALGLIDLIVHGVVSDALATAAEPTLSSRLLSYRAGQAWWRGAQELGQFVRAGRRDLYVLRRDVASYTDSIPTADDSPLWPMVEGTLAPDGTLAAWARAVLRGVIRPAIVDGRGEPVDRPIGVPTGQPIAVVLFNLYLRDVDRDLAGIPGAFYARYSDDIAFAHPDPGVARRAAAALVDRLRSLRLALNDDKSRDWFLTRAGRRSADWPEARGTQHVPLLGLRVGADGTVGLDAAKAREVIRDVRRRAEAAAAATDDSTVDRARLVGAVVRRALDPADTQLSLKSAPLLRNVVTDRRQLAELDHRIAREVAAALASDRSIRVFRVLPPREVRRLAGLPSLVALRNADPT